MRDFVAASHAVSVRPFIESTQRGGDSMCQRVVRLQAQALPRQFRSDLFQLCRSHVYGSSAMHDGVVMDAHSMNAGKKQSPHLAVERRWGDAACGVGATIRRLISRRA